MPNDDETPEEERLLKSGLSIQDTLQSIEDALVELGFDEYIVGTERGTFTWHVFRPGTSAALAPIKPPEDPA